MCCHNTVKRIAELMQLKKKFPFMPGYFPGRSAASASSQRGPMDGGFTGRDGEQEGAAKTSQRVGTLRPVASWENRLGAVGRWTLHNTSTPALLVTSAEPQLRSAAHPSQSHEKNKAILVPCKSLQIFFPFLIGSQSRGGDPLHYAHSNKSLSFST